MYVCMYVCMCVYVCMYVCICMCVYVWCCVCEVDYAVITSVVISMELQLSALSTKINYCFTKLIEISAVLQLS